MRRTSFGWMRSAASGSTSARRRCSRSGVARFDRGAVLVLEVGAQFGVRFPRLEQAFEECSNVKPGSSRQYNDFASRVNSCGGLARLFGVAAGAVGGVGRHHIQQMVGDLRALLERGFGGADIHVAVDLHRVGVDDLHR